MQYSIFLLCILNILSIMSASDASINEAGIDFVASGYLILEQDEGPSIPFNSVSSEDNTGATVCSRSPVTLSIP